MTNVFYRLCQKHNTPFLSKGETCPRCVTDQRAAAVYIGADKEPHEWRKRITTRDAVEEKIVQDSETDALLLAVQTDRSAIAGINLLLKQTHDAKGRIDMAVVHQDIEFYVRRVPYACTVAGNIVSDVVEIILREGLHREAPYLTAVTGDCLHTTKEHVAHLNTSNVFQEKLRVALKGIVDKDNAVICAVLGVLEEYVPLGYLRGVVYTYSLACYYVTAWRETQPAKEAQSACSR